jgi:serine/threonine-protein kinase HipA
LGAHHTDAHAKNVSFFCRSAGLTVAPVYDLVCALVYAGDNVQDRLAMAIGDNFDPTTISAYDWAQLAHENDLVPRLVAQEITRLAKPCLNVLPKLTVDLERQEADPAMLARVRDVVERQAAEALRVAPMIREVDPALF